MEHIAEGDGAALPHDGKAELQSVPVTFRVCGSAAIAALKHNGLLQSLAVETERTPRAEEMEDLIQAQNEWAAVETIQPVAGAGAEVLAQTPPISFSEALHHFQTADLSRYSKLIQPTLRRGGLSALAHFLFGPPRLRRELQGERDLVFTMALCPLDHSQAVHTRILQTVYRQLTGSRLDCPRFGPHWEEIGFQGSDPGTDLRGAGLLGLMQLLCALTEPHSLPLTRELYRLSQHHTQNFPFCIMSINLSRICLQALREECLTRECNRRLQVVPVLSDLFAALLLQLHRTWRERHCTIADSGAVLQEVEVAAKRSPRQLLRQLELHLSGGAPGPTAPTGPTAAQTLGFSSVSDMDGSPPGRADRSKGGHGGGRGQQYIVDDRTAP
uniref:ELMO domain-containing protein 3 isoform X1 n=1 Tax=Petromyzon marinus TaxID=7757 RepID=A0AAJ7SZG4_PETMA|nr:ELMO domain-containing protein 3 isoform X1 [Petromyzon marinus]XP_032808391.1 ELMO domain-containing protein 3 isoform X1 [Petromyzon marinus]